MGGYFKKCGLLINNLIIGMIEGFDYFDLLFNLRDNLETFKLSILMCRFKNIPDILFSNPTLFSEYTEMVYHFFSI